MTEQDIPDRDAGQDARDAGEEPVIPDEGVDAVPPDEVDAGPGDEPEVDSAAARDG